MAALAEKLNAIGGNGKLLEREWRIRSRLNWHTKARSSIRHMLYGERQPSLDEAKQIEIAHLKYCAEQIEAHRAENAKLFDSLRRSLDAMQKTDPEFFVTQVQAVREIMHRLGGNTDPDRTQD
jgi:hypothetical protein